MYHRISVETHHRLDFTRSMNKEFYNFYSNTNMKHTFASSWLSLESIENLFFNILHIKLCSMIIKKS